MYLLIASKRITRDYLVLLSPYLAVISIRITIYTEYLFVVQNTYHCNILDCIMILASLTYLPDRWYIFYYTRSHYILVHYVSASVMKNEPL